jgi:anthranilate synthase component 2
MSEAVEQVIQKTGTVVVIDNYDSFTYNLVQYLGEAGVRVHVGRNDQIGVSDIAELQCDWIVISPGPGRPAEAGVSIEVIQEFAHRIPVLGVCLGHQAIAEAFGGRIGPAPTLMHGKTSLIHHRGCGVMKDLPNPFEATRYHSLVVEPNQVPDCLRVTAWTDDNTIMGLQHRTANVFGVQFHPESILTPQGRRLLDNFLCFQNTPPGSAPGKT